MQAFITACLDALAKDPDRTLKMLGGYWPPPTPLGPRRKADVTL